MAFFLFFFSLTPLKLRSSTWEPLVVKLVLLPLLLPRSVLSVSPPRRSVKISPRPPRTTRVSVSLFSLPSRTVRLLSLLFPLPLLWSLVLLRSPQETERRRRTSSTTVLFLWTRSSTLPVRWDPSLLPSLLRVPSRRSSVLPSLLVPELTASLLILLLMPSTTARSTVSILILICVYRQLTAFHHLNSPWRVNCFYVFLI